MTAIALNLRSLEVGQSGRISLGRAYRSKPVWPQWWSFTAKLMLAGLPSSASGVPFSPTGQRSCFTRS